MNLNNRPSFISYLKVGTLSSIATSLFDRFATEQTSRKIRGEHRLAEYHRNPNKKTVDETRMYISQCLNDNKRPNQIKNDLVLAGVAPSVSDVWIKPNRIDNHVFCDFVSPADLFSVNSFYRNDAYYNPAFTIKGMENDNLDSSIPNDRFVSYDITFDKMNLVYTKGSYFPLDRKYDSLQESIEPNKIYYSNFKAGQVPHYPSPQTIGLEIGFQLFLIYFFTSLTSSFLERIENSGFWKKISFFFKRFSFLRIFYIKNKKKAGNNLYGIVGVLYLYDREQMDYSMAILLLVQTYNYTEKSAKVLLLEKESRFLIEPALLTDFKAEL